MYIRKRYKKLSMISEGIIVIMILGSFLVLTDKNSKSKNNDKFTLEKSQVEENKYEKPETIFNTEDLDRTEECISIEKEIYDKHHINLYYGDETEGIGAKIDATELYNQSKIYKNLCTLRTCLNKYPQGFFKEFEKGKNTYSISIFLVNEFNNENIALATRNTKNDFKIYLSSRDELENVIHHELFHIIEYYLQLEADGNPVFKEWKEKNPEGYIYPNSTQNITTEYTFEEEKRKEDIYFVTRYAKTAEKEDRAETFSVLMSKKDKPYYFSKSYPIYQKAEYLVDVLEDKFLVVKENVVENWERFLN